MNIKSSINPKNWNLELTTKALIPIGIGLIIIAYMIYNNNEQEITKTTIGLGITGLISIIIGFIL